MKVEGSGTRERGHSERFTLRMLMQGRTSKEGTLLYSSSCVEIRYLAAPKRGKFVERAVVISKETSACCVRDLNGEQVAGQLVSKPRQSSTCSIIKENEPRA